MNIIKKYKFYTGLFDNGEITVNAEKKPAQDYSNLLQGYPMASITKESDNDPSVPPHSDKKGNGEELFYKLVIAPGGRPVVICQTVNKYEDDSSYSIEYKYNNRLQLSYTVYTKYNYSPTTLAIDTPYHISEHITYLCDTYESGPDYEDLKYSPGLISLKTGYMYKDNDDTLEQYLYKLGYSFNVRIGKTGVRRYFLDGTRKGDGLNSEKIINDQRTTYSIKDNGQINKLEETRAKESTPGNTIKYLHAAHTSLIVAEFNGMVNTSEQKETAHYLHFEDYLNEVSPVTVSASHEMTSQFFTMTNVEFVDDGFMAKRCLRVRGDSRLSITNDFGIRNTPGRHYIFSCYRKENADSPWKYFQRTIDAASLASDKRVHGFTIGQYLCHITLREEECTVSINVYDPLTMLPTGRIDNYGVPVLINYDRLNRPQMEYTLKLVRQPVKEEYYQVTGDVAVSPLTINGYARFNGYNCERGTVSSSVKHMNITTQFSFPEEGQLIHRSGSKLTGLNSNTLFVAGQWMDSEQIVTIKKTSFTMKIKMSQSRALLFVDDIIKVTSIPILPDQSLWVLFVIGTYTGLIVNGRLIISYVCSSEANVTELSTGSGTSNYASALPGEILVTKKFLCGVSFFDYGGRLIQTQMLRDGRCVLTQKFYDRRGNLVLDTSPAYYPPDGRKLTQYDTVFSYRMDFAKMDFSLKYQGGMSGEIMNFYSSEEGHKYCDTRDDQNWPFVMSTYENSASNRLISNHYMGLIGRRLTDDMDYHNLESYDPFKFINFNNTVNFSANNKRYHNPKSGDEVTLDTYKLFDSNGQLFAKQLRGKSKGYDLENTHIYVSGLTKKSNHVVFFKECYEKEHFNANREPHFAEYEYASTRKRSVTSANLGTRNVFYDSIGNERLFHNPIDNKWKYMRYDVHSRITEAGILVPNDNNLDETFADKVNDPWFPTEADGTITPYYRYHYDKNSGSDTFHLHDGFLLGRLAYVEDLTSNIVTGYAYDYLGNTCEYTFKKGDDVSRKLSYVFDCLGNPKTITYPQNYIVTYVYNDYGQPKNISIKKNGNNTQVNLLSEARYDLFDNLSAYKDSNGTQVVREWTAQGHLTYAGPENRTGVPIKQYSDFWDPDVLTSVQYKDGDKTYTKKLSYMPYGELADVTYVDDSDSLHYYLKYDSRGNLTEFKTDQTYTIWYYKDLLRGVQFLLDDKFADYITVYYDNYGNLRNYYSWFRNGNNYDLVTDDFFQEKVYSVRKNFDTEHYLYFDHEGNLLCRNSDHDCQLYGYGSHGQLAYLAPDLNKDGLNMIHIYCHDLLIAQYDINKNKSINLVYDNYNSLILANDGTQHITMHPKMLFGEPDDSIKNMGVTFQYAGMHYIEELDLYEDNGHFYFYHIGITSSPNLEEESKIYTAFRKFGNRPLL